MSPKEDAAPKPSPAEARRPALSCGAELPPVLWPRAPLCPVPSEAGHAQPSGWRGPCAPRDVGWRLYSVGPKSLLGTENLGLSGK